jgi:hypothetical protein
VIRAFLPAAATFAKLLPDCKIGSAAASVYFEVCSSPKVFELVEYLIAVASANRD